MFWGLEPRRPCSLGAQTPAGRVKKGGVPRPPMQHPPQDRPTHSPPSAHAVPATEGTPAAPRSTSRAGSQAGVLHGALTRPQPHPGQWSREERIKGRVKGRGRLPELQDHRRASHPALSTLLSSRPPAPERALAGEPDRHRAQPSSGLQWLRKERPCSLRTSFFLLQLSSGWAQRELPCANDRSLCCVSCQ